MALFERPQPDLGTEEEVILQRVVAFAIDFIGFGILFGIVVTVLGSISAILGGIAGSLTTIVLLGYFIHFEAEYGQTIGKMLMDIVVVTEKDDPIGYRESVIRTLLRFVDILPFLYIVGFIAIFLTDRKQRVGDLLANTVVVRTKEKADRL